MSGFGEILPTTTPGGLPDVDNRSCQLLGPTALIVQGLMGILVVLSLVYKRHRERPKRPWRIWLFDVSKQVIGQLFVHFSNLLVSDITSEHSSGNACVSYFLNILIDTTFGVALIYVSLHLLTRLCTDRLRLKGFESGVYGDPPSFKFWMRQAAVYLLSLTTMKVVVVTLLTLFPGVHRLGEWLLKWTWLGEQDDFQVVFVMGIFPILMNIIQFWLIDSIVKASSMAGVALDIEQNAQEDCEPLFEGGSDDEHDYHPSRPNPSQRRPSISSFDSRGLDFHDNCSTNTTPEDSGESSKPEDVHGYPPSLSGSMTSDASSHNRVENSSIKKTTHSEPASSTLPRSTQPETLQISGPRKTASQLSARASIVKKNADWTDSWDDADEWSHRKNDSVGN